MTRRFAIVFSVLLVVLVAAPMFGPAGDDSYPLSSYPMFASDRGEVSRFYSAVGLHTRGDRDTLSPRLVGGTSEIVHAAETIRVASQRGTVDGLCDEIAGRLDADDYEYVEVVRDRIDAVGWFDGRREPIDTELLARCPVK